jgi:TonB family protein
MRALRTLAVLLLVLAVPVPALLAQEEPVTAGSDGVPVPKKTKFVQPVYPPEALAQGVRGIVILDLVVSAQGKVESTTVVRSVPGLDEAAIAAARQWEYEPTKVDGKPVRVRLTVPITFSLALPKLARQDGIPELRQGVNPAWPAGSGSGGLATAELTLEPDGRVSVARILEGGPPWSEALLAALRTWRFSPPPEDAVLTFRVEAEFAPGRGGEKAVTLKATGLQRSGLLEEPAPAPAPPVTGSQVTPPPAAEPPVAAPPVAAPTAAAPPVVAPPVTPPAAQQVVPPPVTAAAPVPPPAAAKPAGPGAPPSAGAASPPPVEVITAPPPPLPAENGVSAIRDVTLEPGVPDLAKGRRPTAPPLARMSGTAGTVEVSFSVSAGGTTTIQSATGPELLRPAAEQAVASWVFRRARAERAYLLAVFTYKDDKGAAVVRPQAAPPAGPESPATPTAPPPGS